jgi:ribonuclease J
MGRTAKAIQGIYTRRTAPDKLPMVEGIRTFVPPDLVQVGDIAVTPLMIDHSAFDAYMFVIEAGGSRILHTGDFRLHGVRGGKTLKMLRCYARGMDYVVCEGTTLSRDGEQPMTEHGLGLKAAALMRNPKYVFALCSSTHIDRIGVLYHANPKRRLFVCDDYQKEILTAVREAHAGKSGFYDFKRVYDYAPNLDKLMEEKGFCMLVRQGRGSLQNVMKKYMEQRKDDCLVIYSMWTGYLDGRAKNQGLCDFLAPYGYRVLHTSGHAPPEDLKRLYETVKPKRGLIPIHSDAPELFSAFVPDGKLLPLGDGEEYEIAGGNEV